MKKQDRHFLMAAVAGITMGLGGTASATGEEQATDVKCWGVNGCGAHAKCSVAADDLKAFEALLGSRDFKARFGKSEPHSCAAHAKCGASSKILNWVPTAAEACKTQGGYVVEETGIPKKKVARKA